MRIDAVDFYYLSMPTVEDRGDGSQDALLVRVEADGEVGWGECEAAPLVSIASWVCPMSHSACKPLRDAVLGQRVDDATDLARIHRSVRETGMDLLQTDHTLSGVDIALWDLLGRHLERPTYELLGWRSSYPKTPYASALFGDSAAATYEKARALQQQGFRAAKFGWGPFGRSTVAADAEQVRAAREGLGAECELMVDAGTVWGEDVERAAAVLPVLEDCRVVWLEEPFVSEALHAYAALAKRSNVPLAAGEGCSNEYQARHVLEYGGVGYLQIDAGRIGGLTAALRAVACAEANGVTYVNHTFTTPLALSASLQPYAGLETHRFCEYPVEPSPLAERLTEPLERDAAGAVLVPEAPGLGRLPNLDVIREYLQDVVIEVNGVELYRSPTV